MCARSPSPATLKTISCIFPAAQLVQLSRSESWICGGAQSQFAGFLSCEENLCVK